MMEQQQAMSWSEQLHDGSLITAPGDEEFSNLLDFGMQYSDLEGHGPDNSQMPQEHRAMLNPPTTTAPESDMAQMNAESASHPVQYGQMEGLSIDFHSQAPMQSHPHPMPYSTPSMTPAFCAQDQQRTLSQSQPPVNQQYMQQGQPMIPPTPNSMELHGNAARYLPQRVDENHEMYDRYARINEEQALYTPLVSPAMTPLENQFRLPEYTIPGEYFTPLTSPALEAQNATPSNNNHNNNNNNNNGYSFHSRQVSDVAFVPTTTEANPHPGNSAPSSPHIIRKQNRRCTSNSARVTGRNKVKQSPSMRAQQSRKKTARNINSEELYNHLEELDNKPRNNEGRALHISSNEGSGQDSVSPEALSEPLMPPPAVPPPRKSPAIAPQTSQSQMGEAATPATLMRLRQSQHPNSPDRFSGQAQLSSPDYQDEVMEDISLPEAATSTQQIRPKVARIDTAARPNTASAATSANVTPSLEPQSAPVDRTQSGSIAPSPRTFAMPSPSGPVPRKSEPPKSSFSRKRPSMSSTHASPQLRPKISPSIQPLVKGDDTSALYLASKSNYQHILDGTLPSGVSYPDTLAENLSSKRTNHKLAEQGRRNRINSALKEIESLIPPAFIQARLAKEAAVSGTKPDEKDKEKEKPAQQAISKASAVEMAIDYIKALKGSLDETTAKLAAAEAKLTGGNVNALPVENASTAENTMVNGEASDSCLD